MTELQALESQVKRYIQFVLEEPPSEEVPETGEETSLPPSVLEQFGEGDDYYDCFGGDYFGDYDDARELARAQQGYLYQTLEAEEAYNVRRLGVSERRPDALPHDVSEVAEHARWAVALKQLRSTFYHDPEPITTSPVRLEFLLSAKLQGALSKLTHVLGMKATQAIFHSSPERFLNLLESCAVYQGFDESLVATASTVLGQRNVKRLVLKAVDRFPKSLLRYLQPLQEVPALPYVAEFGGQELLSAYRRAATRDIPADQEVEVRSVLTDIIERTRLLGQLGAEGKKLMNYLGEDFVKQHMTKKPGFSIAIDLVDLGIPIWEDVLQEHIGIQAFKDALMDNPRQLTTQVSQMFRIPNSAAVTQVLGIRTVRGLLRQSDQATLQLSAIGHLIGIRPFLCDDPAIVGGWHPGILELLALGVRFDLVLEAVQRVGREPSLVTPDHQAPEAELWIRATTHLLRELKRIQDAGFYPRPELMLPILKGPTLASDLLGSYHRIRKAFLDIEHFELEDLLTFGEPIDVVLATAYGVVRNHMTGNLPFAQFKWLFKAVLERLERGARVPPLPRFARPIHLTVREAFFQQTKVLDAPRLTALQAELLVMEGEHNLLRAWAHTFDLCRAAGYRLTPEVKNRLDRNISEGRLTTVAAEGFGILFRWVLERYNRLVTEALVRLLIGHHLRTNPDLQTRLHGEEAAQIAEALYELFAERLQDIGGEFFSPFRDLTIDWLREQGMADNDFIQHIQSAQSLGDLHRAITAEYQPTQRTPELERLLTRLRKVFPLTTELFGRYRSLVLRECAKLRPVASDRSVAILLRPSRSLLNVFSGVYGEDCSATPTHAGRLFHPHHVFYQLLVEDSELVQGYVSVLRVCRGSETALKFDVINPSNSINLDAEDFLQKLAEAFGRQARVGGMRYVGMTDHGIRVSNRSSVAQAAQALYHNYPIEPDFILEPPADCFQSSTGGLRVLLKTTRPPA